MFGKAFKATFGVGCAVVIAIIALIVIIGALGSSARPSTSSSPTTAPIGASTNAPAGAAKSWVAIKDFSGSGIKQTETFTVGNEWRIDWTNVSDGYLGVTIYDASSNSPIGIVANVTKAGSDTSFQHRAGTFYLSINASGAWKVGVQDMR